MKTLTKRGQSTGEYAILFAIVLGAVFAVQNFVRHNIAGNLKQHADQYLTNTAGTFTRCSTYPIINWAKFRLHCRCPDRMECSLSPEYKYYPDPDPDLRSVDSTVLTDVHTQHIDLC